MTRKSRNGAAPGLQYARPAVRTDDFSQNSKVLAPDAAYWSSSTAGSLMTKRKEPGAAAAAAAGMALARSLRFSCLEI
jgi:hypothetical protein